MNITEAKALGARLVAKIKSGKVVDDALLDEIHNAGCPKKQVEELRRANNENKSISAKMGKRVDADGISPHDRLDIAKAEAQEFENRRERESWQTREQAEAAAQETAEVIQSDLYGALPLALAGKLTGRIFTAPEVRQIVRAEIDLMVRQWVKGERVSERAIQEKSK